MVKKGCFLFCLIAMLSMTFMMEAYAAKASVWATPTVMTPDEPFTLTVSVEGASAGRPDLSVLKKDFQILSQKNSSAISVINGSTNIKNSWAITLLPKRKGKLTVPAIKVGQDFTNPITIEVTDTLPENDQADKEVFIETDITPSSPYVSGQILITQKLHHAVPIDNASLTLPEVEDDAAEILVLNNRPSYYRTVNNRRYQVIERSYAIFPKRSGEINIAASRFRAVVPDARQTGNGFGMFNMFTSGRSVRAFSKPITIDVKPRNSAYTGQEWLPAKNLTVYGKWSKPVDQLMSGEPVTLVLGIIADGLRAEQLPDLQLNLPKGIKSYAEPVELKNNKTNSGVTGEWIQKFTLIPAGGGEINLPEIYIPWWNVTTDEEEVAVLFSETLKISGEPMTEKGLEMDSSPVKEGIAVEEPLQEKIGWYVGILLAGLLLGGIAYLARCYQLIKQSQGDKQKHIDKVWEQLATAVKQKSAVAMQIAVTRWAKEIAGITPVTLEAIADAENGFLRTEIQALSEALYAKREVSWDGRPLYQKLKQFPSLEANKSQQDLGGLEALNPS
ncbi:MAG: Oxygen tolerance [uncultured Thiotrichaceae bacterium]|uniref:Oxygen tolerance n=1 Tax=uncultured Thiotrichaceae bacterium TaxID=298394 RepID=A0A6S6U162_9GAMM|nr:MAG: Oxygen tolerance [uncultured Thiotrichaceae bacterium]